MRAIYALVLLNMAFCSVAFKLLNKPNNIKEHPKGFGTAKHALIIGKLHYNGLVLS